MIFMSYVLNLMDNPASGNQTKRRKNKMPKEERAQIFDFNSDVDIDLDNLHEEWRSHAQTRYKYAKEVTYLDKLIKQKRKVIEIKKTKLKGAISKLILKIKESTPKATVQIVDAMCADHKDLSIPEKELSDAQNELIENEYEFGMAKNALQAMDDRKTALENEVKLWTRNYFSSPTEERQIESGKSISAKGKDEASKKARTGMNKRRARKDK